MLKESYQTKNHHFYINIFIYIKFFGIIFSFPVDDQISKFHDQHQNIIFLYTLFSSSYLSNIYELCLGFSLGFLITSSHMGMTMLTLILKIIKFRIFRWTKDDFLRFYLSGRATAKSLKQ